MPAPTFEFTDRATPIVQFGRAVRESHGIDKWGRNVWSGARWGKKTWEPLWFDTTCEIHEITTMTGRQSATARFTPGTAYIVASNANQLSELLFPEMPEDPELPEPLPVRTVKAPAGRGGPGVGGIQSVDTDGWTFTDDFAGGEPDWIFPTGWAGLVGGVPVERFKLIDAGFEPEMYQVATSSYVAYSAAQWSAEYPPDFNSSIELTIDRLSWPTSTTSGTPKLVVELYTRMNGTNKECRCDRYTFTPNFAGANTVTVDQFNMGADGSHGAGPPHGVVTFNVGSNGDFGDPVNIWTDGIATQLTTTAGSWETSFFVPGTPPPPGTRIGFYMGWVQGRLASGQQYPPRITVVAGPDFVDTFLRGVDDFWVLHPNWRRLNADLSPSTAGHRITPFQATRGAATVMEDYAAPARYSGAAMAQFDADFEADQFVEVTLTGVSQPVGGVGQSRVNLQLYLHGSERDMSAMTVDIAYDFATSGGDTFAYYEIYQDGPSSEEDRFDDDANGAVNFGDTGGVIPEPEVWRFESGVDGHQRLYHNRVLLLDVVAPNPTTGGRIGYFLNWEAPSPTVGASRNKAPRIELVTGGELAPAEPEEMGMRVRVGVDHEEFGNCWFFNGFVDAIVPTYHPSRNDTVRIECIDALGEAGRVAVPEVGHKLAEATERIHTILNAAGWPTKLRDVADDATVMTRAPSGKALDSLVKVTESCGGFIFGDTDTGKVVFRNQDWLGTFTGELDAYITNHKPGSEDPTVRVCPSGWELSSQRRDLITRVTVHTAGNDEIEPISRGWRNRQAEVLYGIEAAERNVLCISKDQLWDIASRVLRLRSPRNFPFVEAVFLDAAVDAETLDLIARATITKPSRYHCSLRRGGEWVFNRNYMVTGIRHVISPEKWTCRLALDVTSVFESSGARWGAARWSDDLALWGRTR